MEEKSYHYLVLFTGLFLCLLHSGGVSSSCDNINQIDFAEITYEPEGLVPHPDGTVASIECGVFYQIVPTAFERTTCTDGSWTGSLPRCRHVPRYCQRNEDLVQIYGRDCQTPCRNRLNGACPGNKQCHCDGLCGWSCISIYEDNFCPEVADQAGLLVTYDPPERRFNGYADLSCGDGYIYHSGSSRLLCMSNRQWGGGNDFVCIPNEVSSSCDNINQIDFAEITYEPEGLAPHPDGTVASIECGVFYQIVPTAFERTTCTDGSWTGPLPGCRHVPRYCQRNEDLVQVYGRDCQTQCRNRLNGACPGNKQCHCDGVCGWSCISIYEDNFCPEVADQAGLLVTYDPPERRFNGFADFSCGDGYIYHSGSSRLLCMSNRQWGGGNDFVCIPNDNQNPVITCPADFTSDTLTVSFLVYVTDNIDPAPALTYDPLGPGSTFPLGPTTVNVTATDSSSNHESCTFTVTVTVPCGHPVRASRSTIEILPGVQGYVHDTRVRYSCSEGLEIEGTAERECDNGQWTGSTPVCRVPEPPLINLTVVAINHEDPSVDAVAPDTEISAFVADPLARFGTTKIASALTGPDGIAVLSVPHNQSLIITANLDGALVNSITTKANLKQKNIVTIPIAVYEELYLFRWLTSSSNSIAFGKREEGTAHYKVSIPSGGLRVRNRRLVQIEFYGVNLTIPEKFEHVPEPIAVLNGARAELVALDIAGMVELNVFETSTSFRSVMITQPVTITIPITSLSDEFSAGDSMDAWYFDEEHGVWVKDGTGIIEQDRDSDMLVWQYEATHFTWWAAGKPQVQTSCVKVKTCLDRACNLPVPGIRIQLTGEDYGFSSSRTTDRYAEAFFNFKHGRTVTLEAVCAMERVTVSSTLLTAAFDNADADIPSVIPDPLLPLDVCREVTLMLPPLASNMTCPDPGEVEFSVHSLNGRKYSDVVQYTCDIGRTQEGEGYRTCLECGLWSDRPVECILI